MNNALFLFLATLTFGVSAEAIRYQGPATCERFAYQWNGPGGHRVNANEEKFYSKFDQRVFGAPTNEALGPKDCLIIGEGATDWENTKNPFVAGGVYQAQCEMKLELFRPKQQIDVSKRPSYSDYTKSSETGFSSTRSVACQYEYNRLWESTQLNKAINNLRKQILTAH